MKRINLLIVENIPDVVKCIKTVIVQFNSQQIELEINVVADASHPSQAIEAVENNIGTEKEIELVLLDYHLVGRHNGFDFSSKFPQLAYLITSDSDIAEGRYKNEKHQYRYMQLVPDAIDVYEILKAVIAYSKIK